MICKCSQSYFTFLFFSAIVCDDPENLEWAKRNYVNVVALYPLGYEINHECFEGYKIPHGETDDPVMTCSSEVLGDQTVNTWWNRDTNIVQCVGK